jgi:hypothetical protein
MTAVYRTSGVENLFALIRALDGIEECNPPLSEADLTETEGALGFELPIVLRRLYTEISNGGLGLDLLSGLRDDEPSIVSSYRDLRKPNPEWPPFHEQLLPICNCEPGLFICVDRDGMIVTHDESGDTATGLDVVAWLSMWAEGADMLKEMFEDVASA